MQNEYQKDRDCSEEGKEKEKRMNEFEAKIREALKTQRFPPDRVGGLWERTARRYPEVAALGYEVRIRGEHLTKAYPPIRDPDPSTITWGDERYEALEYGWYLRHWEPDRPRDSVDDDIDQEIAAQVADDDRK
jgi:hypothetical protein